MKKLVLILCILSFTTAVIAQQAPVKPTPVQDEKMKAKESVQMKAGKVWYIKDGKSTIVNDEITLGGTKIKADGSVVMKGGTTTVLKEGDYVNADGTVTRQFEKKPEDYAK